MKFGGAGIAVGAMIHGGCCAWGWGYWSTSWHSHTIIYNRNILCREQLLAWRLLEAAIGPPGYVPPRYPSHRPPSYPGYGRPSYPSNRLPATTVNLHPAELHPQRQQRSFDQLRSAQTETRQPSLSRSFR
jgi:hypothetical protein